MKTLWRTRDWKVIGYKRLHPIMCDHCPCESCGPEVAALLKEAEEKGWEVLGPGVIFNKLSVLVGPEIYENSDWYGIEYPEPCAMCCYDPSVHENNHQGMFYFVDCGCSRRQLPRHTYKLDPATGEETSQWACRDYRMFLGYDIPCTCLDLRELLFQYPGLFGMTTLMVDVDNAVVTIGGVQKTVNNWLMWGGASMGRNSFAFLRSGWHTYENMFSSVDIVGFTDIPTVHVYEYEESLNERVSWSIDTSNCRLLDRDTLKFCHENYWSSILDGFVPQE